jgi:hypothetical protein
VAQSDTKLVASAGEHFVCSVLAQLGWAASLTREGVAHADLLAVSTAPGRRMIEMQVKTASGPKPNWPMGSAWLVAAESDREWYAFVLLGQAVRTRPRCFVIPRDHAVAAAWITHEHWRTEPGIPAGRRNAPVVRARVGLAVFGRHEERWDLLDRPTDLVPVLLPHQCRQLLRETRIGFPRWHPWSASEPSDWPGAETRAS